MHGREVKSVRVGAHCPHWPWAASKVPDTPDWGIDLLESSPDHSIQHLTLDRIQFGLFPSCFELWLILVTQWLTGWFHGCWMATPQNSHLLLSAAQNFWWLSGNILYLSWIHMPSNRSHYSYPSTVYLDGCAPIVGVDEDARRWVNENLRL